MMDKHLIAHNVMGLKAIGFSDQEAIDLALDLEQDMFPENYKRFRPERPSQQGGRQGGNYGNQGGRGEGEGDSGL